MKISVIKHNIKQIPILELVEDKFLLKKRPLIIYLHGHTSSKYNTLNEGYALAEQGYRVVLMDLPYHGDRTDPKNPVDEAKTMIKIFDQSLKDLNTLYAHYTNLDLIYDNKVGLVGESLGGIITNIALCKYNWISLAVPLMASPKLSDFLSSEANKTIKNDFINKILELILKTYRTYDLSLNPERINGRPLLMWNDFEDEIVPYQHSYDFYMAVKDNEYAKNFKIVNTNGSGHRVSSEVLYIMRDFIVENI